MAQPPWNLSRGFVFCTQILLTHKFLSAATSFCCFNESQQIAALSLSHFNSIYFSSAGFVQSRSTVMSLFCCCYRYVTVLLPLCYPLLLSSSKLVVLCFIFIVQISIDSMPESDWWVFIIILLVYSFCVSARHSLSRSLFIVTPFASVIHGVQQNREK